MVKNRYCGDLGIVALDFDKASLSFASKRKKVTDEKEMSNESLVIANT